jgi:hypothetical protein
MQSNSSVIVISIGIISRYTVDLDSKNMMEINIYLQSTRPYTCALTTGLLKSFKMGFRTSEAHANFLTEIWTGKVCMETV